MEYLRLMMFWKLFSGWNVCTLQRSWEAAKLEFFYVEALSREVKCLLHKQPRQRRGKARIWPPSDAEATLQLCLSLAAWPQAKSFLSTPHFPSLWNEIFWELNEAYTKLLVHVSTRFRIQKSHIDHLLQTKIKCRRGEEEKEQEYKTNLWVRGYWLCLSN